MRAINKDRLQDGSEFLGLKATKLFIFGLPLGVLLFAVEASFVVVLQGFLLAINIVPRDQVFLPGWYPQGLLWALAILLTFGLVRAFVYSLRLYLNALANQAFISHQRSLILSYAIRFAQIEPAAKILTYFNERMAQSSSVFQNAGTFAVTGISSLFLFVTALILAPAEFLSAIIVLLLFLLPLRLIDLKSVQLGKVFVGIYDNISRILVQGMRNQFFLRVYGLIKTEVDGGQKAISQFEKTNRDYFFLSSIRYSYPQFVGVVAICTVTLLGAFYFKTPGMKLLSLFYLFLRLSQGLSELASSFGEIRYNWSGIKGLYSFFFKIRQQIHVDQMQQVPQLRLDYQKSISVEVSDLTFGYSPERNLFENLNFVIEPGEILLIRGPSGTGKSTMVALILGLLKPSKGSISVNKQPLPSVRESFIQQVGYVGPEPFLVPGSVRENLYYGFNRPERPTDLQLWSALEKAELSELIQKLPQKLNEELFESSQLSTGQRQRLALARAILRQPKFMILDEATANLDPENESKIVDTLYSLRQDMGILVISHKESFDRIATRVLALQS